MKFINWIKNLFTRKKKEIKKEYFTDTKGEFLGAKRKLF